MKGLVRCHHVLHLSQSRIQYYQLLLVAGASAAMQQILCLYFCTTYKCPPVIARTFVPLPPLYYKGSVNCTVPFSFNQLSDKDGPQLFTWRAMASALQNKRQRRQIHIHTHTHHLFVSFRLLRFPSAFLFLLFCLKRLFEMRVRTERKDIYCRTLFTLL